MQRSLRAAVAGAFAMAVALWQFAPRSTREVDLLARFGETAARAQRFSIAPVEVAGSRRLALSTTQERVVLPRVPLFEGAELAFSIALREDVWDGAGDGVTFRVKAVLDGDTRVPLYARFVDPKARPDDRRWIDVRVPLAERLRGRSGAASPPEAVDVVLSTSPGPRADARDDAPLWADVRVDAGGWRWPWRDRRRRPPNVLLVSVDTLRADRVGVSRDGRALTPHIDRVAASGVRFRRAYAPSNHTLQSHMSLLTGLYPKTHGVAPGTGEKRELGVRPLPELRVTLAETLQAAGYATGGFAFDCVWLDRRHGFAQGFDRYAVRWLDAAQMNEKEILPWIASNHRDPFFLFVHFYDVHSDWRRLPYDAPDELRARHAGDYAGGFTGCEGKTCATRHLMQLDAAGTVVADGDLGYIRALYDAGVEATDREIGRLLDALDSVGVLDDTLVVVVSDHGEEFREHGRFIHTQLYEEITRIPMIFRLPSRLPGGGESDVPATLLDVAPTILDIVGVAPLTAMEGRSLLPRIERPAPRVEPFYFTGHEVDAVLDWPWKLILRGERAELYDLAADPLERQDLSGRETDRMERLRDQLVRWSTAPEAIERPRGDAGTVDVPDGEIERLRALGYLP